VVEEQKIIRAIPGIKIDGVVWDIIVIYAMTVFYMLKSQGNEFSRINGPS